jgi:tetratricopeptide (TPR) repeat protein
LNESEIQDVASALQRGDFALFLGAGCSVPLGYPTASELALKLQQEFPEYSEFAPAKGDALSLDATVDGMIAKGLPREKIESFIQRIYTPENAKGSQNPYFVLKQLIRKAQRRPVYVFTTNWDTAVDDAFGSAGRIHYVRDRQGLQRLVGMLPDGLDVVVVKLRGDVGNKKQHIQPNLVLTTKDAQERRKDLEGVYSLFEGKEAEHRLLIIGYRMADEDILALYDTIRGGSTKQLDYLIVAGRKEELTTLDRLGQKYPSLKVHRDEYIQPFLGSLAKAAGIIPEIDPGLTLKFDDKLEKLLNKEKDKRSIVVTGFKYSGKSSCMTRFSLKPGGLLSAYEVVDLPEYTADEDYETLLNAVKNSQIKPALIFLQDHQKTYFDELHRKKYGSGLFDSFEHVSKRMEIEKDEARELYKQLVKNKDQRIRDALSQREKLATSIVESSRRKVGYFRRTHIPALIKVHLDRVCEEICESIQPTVESALLDKSLEEQEELLNERLDNTTYLYELLGLSAEWLAPQTESLVTDALSFFDAVLRTNISAFAVLPLISAGLSTAGIGILGIGLLHGLYEHSKHKEKTVLGYIAAVEGHWGKLSDEEQQLVGYEFESKNNLRPGTGYDFLTSLFSKSTPEKISKSIDEYFDKHTEILDDFILSEDGKKLSAVLEQFQGKLTGIEKKLSDHSQELNRIRSEISEIKEKLYAPECQPVFSPDKLGELFRPPIQPNKNYVGSSKSSIDDEVVRALGEIEKAADASIVMITGEPGTGKSVMQFLLGKQLVRRGAKLFFVNNVARFPIADFHKLENSYALIDAYNPDLADAFCRNISGMHPAGLRVSRVVVAVRSAYLQSYMKNGQIAELKTEPIEKNVDAPILEFKVRHRRETVKEILERELTDRGLTLNDEQAKDGIVQKSELLPFYIREVVKFLEEQGFFAGKREVLDFLPTGVEKLVSGILKMECDRFPELILSYYYVSHYSYFPADLVDALRRVLDLPPDCFPRYCEVAPQFSYAPESGPRILWLHSWYKDIIEKDMVNAGDLHFHYVLDKAYDRLVSKGGLSDLAKFAQGTFDELRNKILEKAKSQIDWREKLDLILWAAIRDSIQYNFGVDVSSRPPLRIPFGVRPLNYTSLYAFLNNDYFDYTRLESLGDQEMISIYQIALLSLVPSLVSKRSEETVDRLLVEKPTKDSKYERLAMPPAFLITYRNLGFIKIEGPCERGFYFANIRKFEKAVKEFDIAIQLDPNNPECHNYRAFALYSLLRFGEALREYDIAIQLNSKNPVYHNNKASALSFLGRHAEALKELDLAIQLDANNSQYHNNRGWALSMLKGLEGFEEALKEFDAAIQLDPNNPDYHNNKGQHLFGLRRYGEALKEFEIAILLEPQNAASHSGKGQALGGLGRYKEALEEFEIAILLAPQFGAFHFNKGNALHRLGKEGDALRELDLAIRLEPNNPEYHNVKGLALAGLGMHTEAVKEYDTAIQLNPSKPDYHSNKGNTFHGLGRFEEAIREYDIAIKLNPQNPLYHNFMGQALRGLGRYEEAIKEFGIAIQVDPNNPEYHNGKAFALAGLWRYGEALTELSLAIQLNPNNPEYHNGKGYIFYNLRRYGEALTELSLAIQLNPNNPEYHNGKGLALAGLGMHTEAVKEYDTAIQLNSSKPEFHGNKGNALDASGRFEEAIREYDIAIQLNPQNPLYHNGKGHALHWLGRYEEAIKEYDAAIELHSGNPEYHHRKAAALITSGRYEEAIKECDVAIQLYANPDYHSNKGTALFFLGRFEEALREYDIAIQLNPQNPVYHNGKGNALTRLGRFEEAIKEFDIAIQLNPNEPGHYNAKGCALLLWGRHEEAIKEFDLAIPLNRNKPEYHFNKGNALSRLGRYEEAIKEYDIAIQLKPNDPDYHKSRRDASDKLNK